jgi:hypothetical protein
MYSTSGSTATRVRKVIVKSKDAPEPTTIRRILSSVCLHGREFDFLATPSMMTEKAKEFGLNRCLCYAWADDDS